MVVDVERTYVVAAPIEDVWELLADPAKRARAISVVERFEVREDDTIWYIALPVPLMRGTIEVRTWDVERDPPTFVRFAGESSVMEVTGEHELTAEDEDTTSVRNRFVVDGAFPGVETFFKRNIDGELDRIQTAVEQALAPVEEG